MPGRARCASSVGESAGAALQGRRCPLRIRALRRGQGRQGQAGRGRMREVPQGPRHALSFGAYLKQSRTLRELSLDDVATATRLPPRILEALEADDFTPLQDRAYALLVAPPCAAAIA